MKHETKKNKIEQGIESTSAKNKRNIRSIFCAVKREIKAVLNRIRDWRMKKAWPAIKKSIKEYRPKSNWVNITVLLVNIVTLAAYCHMDLAIAEYEGTKSIYLFAFLSIILLVAILIWELICIIGPGGLEWIRYLLHKIIGKICGYFQLLFSKSKINVILSVIIGTISIISGVLYFWYNPWPFSTKYYASVREIYGIPTGIGEPLSALERQQCAKYWRIEEYMFRPHITLTFIDSYGQLDLFRQYSSAYSMSVFQEPARIEIDYIREKDEDKYRSYGQDFFMSAKENGFRKPVLVSYYNSAGRRLLEMEANDDGDFEITFYSSADVPQLLNSTLLRMPESQTAENGIASRQIETIYNSDGLPLIRRMKPYVYNLYGINGEQYTYNQEGQMTSLCYLDVDGGTVCNEQGIMLVTFQYDESGKLEVIRYFSDENGAEKIEGFNGVFCEKFEYDECGNLICRKHQDRSGNWCFDKSGVYRYQYDYERGRLAEESFWGLDDNRVQKQSFHSKWIKFEREGRKNKNCKISVSFEPITINDSEVPAYTPDTMPGIEETLIKKNEGQEIISTEIGERNEPTESVHGRKYNKIQYNVKNGCIEEVSYRDGRGNLAKGEAGYATERFQYDSQLRVVTESYWDNNGSPYFIDGGYMKIRKTYNSSQDNRIKRIEYLDELGNLTFNEELGYSDVIFEYTSQGKNERIQESYFDPDGEPISRGDMGYAAVERIYNDGGFLIKEAYFNEHGVSAYRQDYRVAEILYEYNDNGNLCREYYKDVNGENINRFDTGYAVVYREFNAGQVVKIHYEGYQGKDFGAVPDKTTGVFITKYDYKNGHKVLAQYFDADEKLILRKDVGCAEQRIEYNDAGLFSAVFSYGVDGNLIFNRQRGCAFVKYQYNKLGQIISENFYDTKEVPVINTKHHCAGFQYEYDENGNLKKLQYLDVDGNLMIHPEKGIAQICDTYDDVGKLLKEEYLDIEGNLAIHGERGYAYFIDDYVDGNCIESQYYDIENNLIICKDKGYARRTHKYNDRGQCISSHFYDTKWNLTISTQEHCAGYIYDYDERGNTTDIWYLGTDGSPAVRDDLNCAHIQWTYDKVGNVTSIAYFDTEEKPVNRRAGGYAFCEYGYQNKNRVKTCYYDLKKNPMLLRDAGYSVYKQQYDNCGRIIFFGFYDTEEKLVINKKRHYAGMKYAYDLRGNETDIWYLGVDESPIILDEVGYAHKQIEYDEYGNKLSISFFDSNEEPAIWKEGGYASVKYQYDELNQCVLETYYGLEGEPIIPVTYHCAGK